MSERRELDTRVLVFAPLGRDAELACNLLKELPAKCISVNDAQAFSNALPEGQLVLLTEEALSEETLDVLEQALSEQPSWSDVPIIVLLEQNSHSQRAEQELQRMSSAYNLTLLNRPLSPAGLLSVVRAGLRARKRQLEVRDLLEERVRMADELEHHVEERTADLKRSEQRFATAFHASPTPTVIVRLDNRRILDANKSFAELVDFERSELLGHTGKELGIVAKPEAGDALWESLKKGERQDSSEITLCTKSGALRHVLVYAEPIEVERQACLLCTVLDVTERRKTETQLVQAIETVMKDASWFSRSIMHQLAQIQLKQPSVHLAELTEREGEVLEMIARGYSNKEMAKALDLSVNTIRNHVSNLYDKIEVHSRPEAVIWARERGIV